ncbi:MAG TPA: proton-conducting transporter membrane subunit [Methanocorpusculum sp.]|nr:proton-conducting transporter membrane subunit [Methanocorpusculum sp.]
MITQEVITIMLLLFLPLLAALCLAIFRQDGVRNFITVAATVIIIAASIFLTVTAWGRSIVCGIAGLEAVPILLFVIEFVIGLIILGLAIKYKRVLPAVLAVIQAVLVIFLEVSGINRFTAENIFMINELSLIMVLIIGIIGTLICVYALGYMKDYHEHQKDVPDRKRFFFAILFLFLSAMFGVVLTCNLQYLICFWEITTLCSFLLIGYSKTPEATTNSFRAVWMNLIGGIAFTGALIALCLADTSVNLLDIPTLLSYNNVTVLGLPLALIAIAGLTKAAQMPFSSWLTSAMVAPTPVSALLHSSTMVKAGVYLLVVFAPLFSQSWVGIALALVGMFTFAATSALAIAQSNAKRVLAYSTIANLGLIVACAGIGTPAAVTAAIFLIIFHAVAKALLFICVGAVEHKIGSRDIEDMDALLARQPLLASMMVIGIAGMYLAPFGMLISKWAALEAFLDAPFGFVFIVLLGFGSAFTVFFWTKWLGKLYMRMAKPSAEKTELHTSEKAPIVSIGVLVILAMISFPLVYVFGIKNYLLRIYSSAAGTTGVFGADTVGIWVAVVIMLGILVYASIYAAKSGRSLKPYLCGRAVNEEGRFLGSLGVWKEAKAANYYFEDYCGEKILMKPSVIISILLILAMIIVGCMRVLL